jgi:hypothetical protein
VGRGRGGGKGRGGEGREYWGQKGIRDRMVGRREGGRRRKRREGEREGKWAKLGPPPPAPEILIGSGGSMHINRLLQAFGWRRLQRNQHASPDVRRGDAQSTPTVSNKIRVNIRI